MRKVLLASSLLILMSATANAGGWGNRDVQTRWGMPVNPPSGICSHTIAWAQVHDYGVRFTVWAWGCEPGHVLTVWGIVGEDPTPGAGNVTLNCGGGIVFPNGRFKTICDVPIGNLDDSIAQCQGFDIVPGFLSPSGGCPQVVEPPQEFESFKDQDLFIDILTHDELETDISMAQIRTLTTCSFWDLFGFPPVDYPREDSCGSVALIKFAAPRRR